MRKLACGVCFFALGTGLAVGCGGSSDTDLFNGQPNATSSGESSSGSSGASSGTSGQSSSGTSGQSSSGTSGQSSSGSSGSSGTSGTVDGGPVDSGKDAAMEGCRPAVAADCPANTYCKLETCNATRGKCVAKPAINNVKAVVCGCDDVNYWNESLAFVFNIQVKATGECANPAPCVQNKCAGARFCSTKSPNLACATAVQSCWGLPNNCPGGEKATNRQCIGGGNVCTTDCESIKTEKGYYLDGNCP